MFIFIYIMYIIGMCMIHSLYFTKLNEIKLTVPLKLTNGYLIDSFKNPKFYVHMTIHMTL